jgi:hypothetical protein
MDDHQRIAAEKFEESGAGRTLIRLTCVYDGETHIYQFPPGEAQGVAEIIALHVGEGQLIPEAGSILCLMAFNEIRNHE